MCSGILCVHFCEYKYVLGRENVCLGYECTEVCGHVCGNRQYWLQAKMCVYMLVYPSRHKFMQQHICCICRSMCARA